MTLRITSAQRAAMLAGKRNVVKRTQTFLCANGKYKTAHLSPRNAIRAFCVQCLGFETRPTDCGCTVCPLYPYRGGTRICATGTEDKPSKGAA